MKVWCTFLVEGDTASDFQMKPLTIYHTKNPQTFKVYARNAHLIIWQPTEKNGLQDLHSHCHENLKSYLQDLCLKIIFPACCISNWRFTMEDITALYSSSARILRWCSCHKTTILSLQPMDQEVVQAFRAVTYQKLSGGFQWKQSREEANVKELKKK
jgi:hypothetical protein